MLMVLSKLFCTKCLQYFKYLATASTLLYSIAIAAESTSVGGVTCKINILFWRGRNSHRATP